MAPSAPQPDDMPAFELVIVIAQYAGRDVDEVLDRIAAAGATASILG